MSASLNRPVGVKRFQTFHHYSVDVTHGLVFLFGIGTKVYGVFLVKKFMQSGTSFFICQFLCSI
jgi:hypothetical protein